jgi:C1A family cysteine protease
MDRKYGYIPDPKDDGRDKKYAARVHSVAPPDLPRKTNNIETAPSVVDQENIGSCVGNAVGAALEDAQIAQGRKDHFMPSRLFIYYCTRLMEGTVSYDNGCCIRNAIKVVSHLGAPEEALWPYNPDKFKKCPPFAAYKEARNHQSIEYYKVDWTNLTEIKTCLAGGHGIVFGFQVPESFETEVVKRTGIMQMPVPEEVFMGGHAVFMLDYDDDAMFPGWSEPGGFLVQNSWGTDWGIKGRFWMPYRVATSPDLSDDFWTIRTVE